MIVQRSATGYGDAKNRLLEAIKRRGLTIFARIDHAAAASDAGLSLPPEEVVVFGNPLAGTPLMQEDRRIGLELPLRVLLWEERDGVFLAYADPRDLITRYAVKEHRATLEAMAELLAAVTAEAGA